MPLSTEVRPYEIDGADKCGAFCHFMRGFSKKGAKKENCCHSLPFKP